MNDAFTSWALGRGGFFTRGEAKDYGYSDSDIQSATHEGHWVRLRHGYYAPGDLVAGLNPLERHSLQGRAVQHRLGPEYALVGTTACAVQGVEVLPDDLSTVHVARIGGRSGRKEAGIRYHNFPFDPSDIVRVGDAQVVRPGHAVWHGACDVGTESALVLFNSAMHQNVATPSELDERASAFERWRGSRTARLAYRLSDPRVETVGESRTLFLCWENHVPWPEPQVEIRDAAGRLIARTDFAWDVYRHVCEFDGKVKYEKYARPGESVSDVVLREKAREDLVRAQRWGMTRLIWIDLLGTVRRRRTAALLWQGMEQSRRLYTRNRTVLV